MIGTYVRYKSNCSHCEGNIPRNPDALLEADHIHGTTSPPVSVIEMVSSPQTLPLPWPITPTRLLRRDSWRCKVDEVEVYIVVANAVLVGSHAVPARLPPLSALELSLTMV